MPQRLLLRRPGLMAECDIALSPGPDGLIHFL
jgi:hypothetical protein